MPTLSAYPPGVTGNEPEITGYNGRCEDFPCCGHTSEDPCTAQPYDAVDYFDTRRNPHAFCEHEYGFCDVDEDGDDD